MNGWRNDPDDEPQKEFRSILDESLVRHSYPMINRLHALRVFIDDYVLSQSLQMAGGEVQALNKAGEVQAPDKTFEKALTWTTELLDLNASLNAPLHFTPLQLGTTCALVYLLSPLDTSDSQQAIRDAAERSLLSSQEMYTMRRAFYENISDLYYLYDDFNDRQLHFNHAIQMAGAELSSLLRHLIRIAKEETTQPCETPPGEAPAAEPTCAG